MPTAIRVSKVETYYKGVTPINSHDPLIMCSSRITCQTKIINLQYYNAYDHQTSQGDNFLS